MTTEKTSSPRRSGADWFGLVAFAVLVICSAVLVVRLISTKFLPTGQLLLAVGALLVLSGLHGWVQLPRREKTGGKIACGIVALVLAAAMLYGAVALGSVQHAITDVADKSVETDITCVIVNADDPAQSLDDVKGYRFGILEDRDTENTQSLLQQLQEKLGAAEHTAYASPALLTDALYDDQVGAILLNKGYIPLLEEQEGYADFSDRTRILYEYTTAKTVQPTPADTNAPVDVTKDPFVVYCSGIDARSSNINITSRSDVNILAVVNPSTKQVALINTPRDYYVDLAGTNSKDKLTHAGLYGVETSMATLGNLYGVNVDQYLRINFAGFISIIDAVGGVDVYSDQAFTSVGSPGYYDPTTFAEGWNHLDGKSALAFARERHAFASGDIQRGINQMKVIDAMMNKIKSPTVLMSFSKLMDAVSDCFVTSLSQEQISALVRMQLASLSDWDIQSYTVTGTGGKSSQCYSAKGQSLYVMKPDENSVSQAKELIASVLGGEGTVSDTQQTPEKTEVYTPTADPNAGTSVEESPDSVIVEEPAESVPAEQPADEQPAEPTPEAPAESEASTEAPAESEASSESTGGAEAPSISLPTQEQVESAANSLHQAASTVLDALFGSSSSGE